MCINVQNLFQYGEVIGTPWDDKPGFLSYKVCPALWTLGARPNNSAAESNALIEEIISCARLTVRPDDVFESCELEAPPASDAPAD